MKELSKEEIEKLIEMDNVIEIYDDQLNYKFIFYYIYSGDSIEAVFLNNKFYSYIDLEEYVDKIKTRKDEKKYLTKLINKIIEDDYYNILENLEFIDSNILKDIRGEVE